MANILRSIREHIKTNPNLHVDESKGFGVDYLAENNTAYMVEAVPTPPIIKRYINGDTERQFVFAFSTRESYGSDVEQNLDNLGVLEEFGEWLEGREIKNDLPDLGIGKSSIRYEVRSPGYAFQTSIDKAQYRIQCALIYSQEGEKQ